MTTFHGPMVAKDFAKADGMDLPSWQAALGGADNWGLDFGADSGVKPLVEGSAEGVLYGGGLWLVGGSFCAPFEIHTESSILFFSVNSSKPFSIYLILMQLELGRKLCATCAVI